jgi:hypothetical protein
VAESSVFAYHIQLIFCSRPSAGYIVYWEKKQLYKV